MEILNLVLALFLLMNLGAGMWRILRGPTAADRMLAAQLPPPIVTALLTIAVGLLASVPFSPLQWARFVSSQEYGP